MNWLGNLRNWFAHLGGKPSVPPVIRTRNVEIKPSGRGVIIRYLPQSPSIPSPVMQPFTDELRQKMSTVNSGNNASSNSLMPDQDCAALMKEYALLLWTAGFKNPPFPPMGETIPSESGQPQNSWARDHLVLGWQLLRSWLSPNEPLPASHTSGSSSGSPSSSSDKAPFERPNVPIWHVNPAGQLLLDKSIPTINFNPTGYRLVIFLSSSVDQSLVEKTGRHLSETNLSPVLLTGPSILLEIPANGHYFLPYCRKITFLLDQADYSPAHHTMLNLICDQMSQALSIPATLETSPVIKGTTTVPTPVVEREPFQRTTNPWFPSRNTSGDSSYYRKDQDGDIQIFPSSRNQPSTNRPDPPSNFPTFRGNRTFGR